MKFRTRIWLLPQSAAAVFIVGVALSFFVAARTSSIMNTLDTVDRPFLDNANALDHSFDQIRMTLQSAVSEGDGMKLQDADAIAAQARDVLKKTREIPGKAEAAQRLSVALDNYTSSSSTAVKAMLSKTPDPNGQALVSTMQAAQGALEKLLTDSIKQAKASIETGQVAARNGVTMSQWVMAVTGLLVLLVLGGASFAVINSVWKDLGGEPADLRDTVQRVADGDLSVHLDTTRCDSGSLQQALAGMIERVRDTVHVIHQSAQSIRQSSTEIASGNQDLSSRTEHTASNLEQTAASMEQLTGTVRQSADSANQANTLAHTATDAAERGGRIVGEVVSNMDEINAASRKITEIISVIDGIAFQTNILALNAAVEAARAGDQGRGFAVVASEVRTLAQRSAQAAKEIKSLLNASAEKVESGARLVQDAGGAMREIVAGVQRVTDIIGEISTAAHEQSNGIGQVNQAVTQLDHITQQNAALVQESATAAESLKAQADRLIEAVAVFHLSAHDRA